MATATFGFANPADRMSIEKGGETWVTVPERPVSITSRDACLVNEDYGARARGQAWPDRGWRQVLGGLIDVGEHGHCSDIARGVRGGDEREGGDDDLVTGADPGNYEGQVQGRGT